MYGLVVPWEGSVHYPVRRKTVGVKNGTVQKKNRHRYTPNYWSHAPLRPVVDKERPGPGYKHFVSKRDLYDFIDILPDWDELAIGLRAVLLCAYDCSCLGWYSHRGVIAICAWERELWVEWSEPFVSAHAPILDRLKVERAQLEGESILCKLTPAQVRAFQLLHVFLHELGHHHDRITTRSKAHSVRGESYAEQYAFKYEAQIWKAYVERFGDPATS